MKSTDDATQTGRNQHRIANITVSVVRDGSQLSPAAILRNESDSGALFLATAPKDDEREHFRIAILDIRRRVKALYTVSVGSMSSSLVHPREVFRPAIVAGAAAIILSHNHPSGDPDPSADDIALTRRLAAAGALLGIEVLDHIITGEARFVSLRSRGVL